MLHGVTGSPYCLPTDACWPTPAAWAALNASVGGRLLANSPIAAPCYVGGAFTPAAADCAGATANATSGRFRSGSPFAMQYTQWEVDAEGRGCSFLGGACATGGLPAFAVAAGSDADVAAALRFAAANRVRVVVKSTGHELQGRSTAPGALIVWMHRWRGVAVAPDWAPPCGGPPAPAVIVTGGAQWADVYAAADAAGVHVVGGDAPSVGACGGYTLGGGHSFSSPAFGLAVDNVLAFTAVLANGTSVAASACENADLFWALRGGGGGSFAVVTSCAYAAHPVPAAGVTGLAWTVLFVQGAPSASAFLDLLFSNVGGVSFGDVVAGGYVGFAAGSSTATLVINSSAAVAADLVNGIRAAIAAQPAHFFILDYAATPYRSMIAWHAAARSVPDPTGSVAFYGASRLVPLRVATDAALRASAVGLFVALAAIPGFGIALNLVCGAGVAAAAPGSTSVTPAWRAAAFHAAVFSGLPPNASAVDTLAMTIGIHNISAAMAATFPGSGAYFSESDFLEPNWQDAFWGANYGRLQAVKAAYDPSGLFACWHCVELPPASPTPTPTPTATATSSPTPTATETATPSPTRSASPTAAAAATASSTALTAPLPSRSASATAEATASASPSPPPPPSAGASAAVTPALAATPTAAASASGTPPATPSGVLARDTAPPPAAAAAPMGAGAVVGVVLAVAAGVAGAAAAVIVIARRRAPFRLTAAKPGAAGGGGGGLAAAVTVDTPLPLRGTSVGGGRW